MVSDIIPISMNSLGFDCTYVSETGLHCYIEISVICLLCSSKTQYQNHETFNKDVILLPNPAWEVVCKQKVKHQLHERGFILSAFEFQKSWDHNCVLTQIREGFSGNIPPDVR